MPREAVEDGALEGEHLAGGPAAPLVDIAEYEDPREAVQELARILGEAQGGARAEEPGELERLLGEYG